MNVNLHVALIHQFKPPLLQGLLYVKNLSKKGCELLAVDTQSFRISEVVNLEGKDWGSCVMFSDGENLGMITSVKDVS